MPRKGSGVRGAEPPHEPLHAVVTSREAVLGAEILPDPLGRKPLVELGQDHRTIDVA